MLCDRASSVWRARLPAAAVALFLSLATSYPASAQGVCAIASLTATGWSAYHSGDTEAARDAFATVQEECRLLAEPRVGLGYVELRLGNVTEARKHFDGALDLDSEHADALKGLARVEARQGRLAESEDRWRALAQRFPDDVEALLGVSRTVRWQGRLAEAEAWLERAERIEPTSDEVREERHQLAALSGPVVGTRLIVESDSDGNVILSSLGSARWVIRGGLEVRWDGYLRSTTLSGQRQRAALGHLISTRTRLASGWSVQGGVGGSETNVLNTGVRPSGFLTVASPAGRGLEGSFELRSAALDITTQTIERSVSRQAATVGISLRGPSKWTGSVHASGGTYEGSESNGFWRFETTLSRQESSSLTVGSRVRGFGFANDVTDGYFDPQWFVAADVPVEWELGLAPLTIALEVAPGVQRSAVTKSLDASLASALTGRIRIRPGRDFWISALWARSGAERITSGTGSYSYASFTAGGTWAF